MQSTTPASQPRAGHTLTPLEDLHAEPRRLVLVPAALVAAVVLFAISMPLAWHHHVIPAAGYTIVHGYQGANWLIVAAVIALVFAIVVRRRGFGYYGRWLLTIVGFLVTLGVYADYVDAGSRAYQIYVAPYYGPGFFVGVAATAVLVITVVAAWRTRD